MSHIVRLRAAQARKMPHPNQNIVSGLSKLSLLVNCADMPKDISFAPNPRTANQRSKNKKVYKQVKASLLGIDGTESGFFDLKNRGIVIIVKSAKYLEKDKDDYVIFELVIPDDYGLADGGHTFDLISEINSDPELHDKLKALNQFVEVRVIEIPHLDEADDLIAPVAKGLNSSVQVDEMSIANLDKKFEETKKVLENEFSSAINSWPSENDYEKLFGWEMTDISYMDAKEMFTIASVLDITQWPNSPAVQCYSSPSTVFDRVLKNDAVDKFNDILPDILRLYNMIQHDFPHFYNQVVPKGKAGRLAFVDYKNNGEYLFPFIDKSSDKRLMKGASLPILAAFKMFVIFDEHSNKLAWRESFQEVVDAWNEYHPDIISRTVDGAKNHRRNVANAIGKDATHWQSIRDGLLLKTAGL